MINYRISATAKPFPEEHAPQVTDVDELALVREVSARDDTAMVLVEDRDKGTLAAYAVLGFDEDGTVTIYAARSWLKGMGAIALQGLFKGATVINRPMRVHTETLERFKAYAKMLGASEALEALDADGIRQGVYYG